MGFNALKAKMIFNITHENKSDVRNSIDMQAKNFFHQVNLFRKKREKKNIFNKNIR